MWTFSVKLRLPFWLQHYHCSTMFSVNSFTLYIHVSVDQRVSKLLLKNVYVHICMYVYIHSYICEGEMCVLQCACEGSLIFPLHDQARWCTSFWGLFYLHLPSPRRNARIVGLLWHPAFTWVLGFQIRVLRLVWQALSQSPAQQNTFYKAHDIHLFSLCEAYGPCYNFSTLLFQPEATRNNLPLGRLGCAPIKLHL